VNDKSYIRPALQGLILSLLISPFFIQIVVDNVIGQGEFSLLNILFGVFLFLKVFEILTLISRRLIFQLLSKVLSFDLKSSIFHHLIRLPISYFQRGAHGTYCKDFHLWAL